MSTITRLKALLLPLLFLLVTVTSSFAQVGIGTTTPNANSILELNGSNKGLLLPRMTTAQRIAFGLTISPAEIGMLVMDTDLKTVFIWNGTSWSSPSRDWRTNGNANVSVSDYLGTSDNADLSIRTNAIERIGISGTTGNISLSSLAGGGNQIIGVNNLGVLFTLPSINLATQTSGTLPIIRGGTGISTTPINGQLLIGNGTGYAQSTLTTGTGINISNGSGSITITNSAPEATTANNGLTLTGSNVTLGGNLTGATTLGLGSNNLLFTRTIGNLGIGASSPAAILSVGGTAGNFQVNNLGAIVAATGVVSSGSVTFSGLGGGGSRVVGVDNAGLLSAVVAAIMPFGTATNNTLRWNGTNWVESTNIKNTGTSVGIGISGLPTDMLSVGGATGNFRVNASGDIVAAASVAASGTINFSSLGTGVVKSSAGLLSSSLVNLATEVTGTLPLTSTSGILPVARGGTALSAAPANGQIPIGNGTGYTLANITAGTGISIANTPGSITINATGGIANGLGTNNTLRWNGSAWVESNNLTNDADGIGIGSSPIPGNKLWVSYFGVTTPGSSGIASIINSTATSGSARALNADVTHTNGGDGEGVSLNVSGNSGSGSSWGIFSNVQGAATGSKTAFQSNVSGAGEQYVLIGSLSADAATTGQTGSLLSLSTNGNNVSQTGLSLNLMGASTSSKTGINLNVFDATGGTTTGLNVNVSGGAVRNAANFTGGNVGITLDPTQIFNVGGFVVNHTGAISAASGITSSGNINFSSLGSGVVRSTAGTLGIGGVDLATDVTGTLPIANGGTGASSAAQNAVFVGPVSGGPGAPNFRPLTNSDIPSLDLSKINSGITPFNLLVGGATGNSILGINMGSGQMLVGQPSGYPQALNIFGDVAFTAGGASTIQAGAVNLATDINGILGFANGGTGVVSTPFNGTLLIGNGTGYTSANLTAGPGIGIANAPGSITISATGGLPANSTNSLLFNNGTSWQASAISGSNAFVHNGTGTAFGTTVNANNKVTIANVTSTPSQNALAATLNTSATTGGSSAISTIITNSSDGIAVGQNINATASAGVGTLYGVFMNMNGAGTGSKIGSSVSITGTGSHTGYATSLTADATTASQLGQNLFLTTSGNNVNQTGVSMTLTGVSTGNKTGVNINLNGATAGTTNGLSVSVSGGASTYAATFNGGNVGIGTTTPNAALAIGSTNQFQVNTGGAIAAATGITSSGAVTLSGLGGGGTRMVAVDNAGLLSAVAGSTIANGTSTNNTLYWSGSAWVESSALLNNGTNIGIGVVPNATTRVNVNYPAGATVSPQGVSSSVVTSAATGIASAFNASITASGAGTSNGVRSAVSSTSTGALNAYDAFFSGSGTGNQTAFNGSVNGTGTGAKRGVYIDMPGGTGANTAFSTFINGNTGQTSQSGLDVNLASGNINLTQIGANLLLSGTSTANKTAIAATVNGGTTNTNTGLSLNVSGGAGSTNRGLDVSVSGGTIQYAALFNGGNVGIGTTTPGATLDVVGTSNFAGTTNLNGQINVNSGVVNNILVGTAITNVSISENYVYMNVSGTANLPSTATAGVGRTFFIIRGPVPTGVSIAPATGDRINSLAVNASFPTTASNRICMVVCVAAGQWMVTQMP